MVNKCLILLLYVPQTQRNALQKLQLLFPVTCCCTQWDVYINVIGFTAPPPSAYLSQCLLRISQQNYVCRSLHSISGVRLLQPQSEKVSWDIRNLLRWFRTGTSGGLVVCAVTNLLLHTIRRISWLASQGRCCMHLASNHSTIRRCLVGTTNRA